VIKFKGFTGINNVLSQHEMGDKDLVAAQNVDVDTKGKLWRRQGYTSLSSAVHRNLFESSAGYLLSTIEDGSLVARAGATETAVHTSMGPDRVWYADLPDKSVVFTNGLIAGITDGVSSHRLGVPVPVDAGEFMSVPGQLFPGRYQWAATHVRLSDGLEGGTSAGGVIEVTEGGILLTGLPMLDGHKTNIYLTGANGDELYLAGETLGPAFSFTGTSDSLVIPCRTQHMHPMPPGRLCAFWRGRMLMAVGNLLVASRVDQWELFDPRMDFKQFGADITLVQPVADGIYVGTEDELAFLSGVDFSALTYVRRIDGPVVLGSGVAVPGDKIGDGGAPGDAMVCIAGKEICTCSASGSVRAVTAGVYEVADDVTEVFAAFREVRGIPQYLATPV
jgi:hypothetical protein